MKHLKYIPWILLICSAGCAGLQDTSESVSRKEMMRSYLLQVKKTDGINREEALLIAKSELYFRGLDKMYNLNQAPAVFEDDNRWAVSFTFHHKTFQQLISEPRTFILIEKKDGSVFLDKQYKQGDFVLAHLFRRYAD